MTAAQQLEDAITLLKGRYGSLEDMGPDCVAGARASALIVDAIYDGRIKTTPLRLGTADAALPMRDQPAPRFAGQSAATPEVDPTRPASGVVGAQAANDRVGAKLVQRLPKGPTAYFIQALGDGTAGLFEVTSSDDLMDPGKTRLTGDRLRRIRAGDADRSRRTLVGINEKNRAAWANR